MEYCVYVEIVYKNNSLQIVILYLKNVWLFELNTRLHQWFKFRNITFTLFENQIHLDD